MSRLEHLATAVGLLLWGAVGIPVAAGDLVVPPLPGWWIAYLGYGPALAAGLVPAVRRRRPAELAVLAVLVATGVAAYVLDGSGFTSVLLAVSAAAAAFSLPVRAALAVAGVQTAACTLTVPVHDAPASVALTQLLAAGGIQLFALGVVAAALHEERRRLELAALNVQLAAAHARLEESSRAAERLRISRDLHDVMGHQLTALAVNLEVAAHLARGEAVEPVATSRRLARQMLADVRDVVARLREPPSDLAAALATLVAPVPRPAVHLTVDPTLRTTDPRRAAAVVQCVQELVTNAVRHARAGNLWVDVAVDDGGGVIVRARDDGRGAPDFRPGNGLSGMRERVEELGGRLRCSPGPSAGPGSAAGPEPAAGPGFRVEAWIPAS